MTQFFITILSYRKKRQNDFQYSASDPETDDSDLDYSDSDDSSYSDDSSDEESIDELNAAGNLLKFKNNLNEKLGNVSIAFGNKKKL